MHPPPAYTGVLIASLLHICTAKIEEIPLPRGLQSCYDKVQHADIETFVGSTYSWFCETAMKGAQMDRPMQFDALKQGYFNRLHDKSIEYNTPRHHGGRLRFRMKRQSGNRRCVRREYRMLSDDERRRFHAAINALKQDTSVPPNKYDALAMLHVGTAVQRAHGGAGFPGWHRVYITLFETALQEEDPSVCLPYWDSTLDGDLEDPSLSPVWGPSFFGTPNGAVTEGPFAGWTTPEGSQLMRNVGSDGDPFTTTAIADILSQTRHDDIVTSDETDPRFDLEFHHAAVHVFCGGTMGQLDTAAFDPVFFMHHAFVDYIWEMFRTRLRGMGMDSELYPVVANTSAHHGSAQLGFGNMTQRDAYSDAMADGYQYENSPVCSQQSPDCFSRHLTCFAARGRCVPTEPQANVSPQAQNRPTQQSIQQPNLQRQPQEIIQWPQNTRQPQQPPVQTSQQLIQTPGQTGQIPHHPFFTLSPNQFLPSTATSPNHHSHNGHEHHAHHTHQQTSVRNTRIEPRFPNTDTCTKSAHRNYGNAVQNNYCCDKTCDTDEWAIIPVKVVSVRPPKFRTYQSFPVKNGSVNTQSDIYSPSAYAQTNKYISSKLANPKTFERCLNDDSVSQVFLSSKGINYDGYYKEASIIDNRLAVSISMGFINVKKPSKGSRGVTKALLRAHDACGRICHPACRDAKSGEYKACSGAVAVSNRTPLMYGDTYDQAVMSVFDYKYNNDCPAFKTDNFFITFYCDYHNHFPYAEHHHGEVKPAEKQKQVKVKSKSVKNPPILEPVVVPQKSQGCRITNSCVLDVACGRGLQQCFRPGEIHRCRDSCRSYAICRVFRYSLRLCPRGHYFDDDLKTCVTGYCRKVADGPRQLDQSSSRSRIQDSYSGQTSYSGASAGQSSYSVASAGQSSYSPGTAGQSSYAAGAGQTSLQSQQMPYLSSLLSYYG